MPFQPINFANISPQHSALADVLGTYMKGYQESQIPKETAMKQEQQRIANETAKTNLQYLPGEKEMAKSLNAMRLKYMGPQAEANLALAKAQREKALRPPQYKPSEVEQMITGLRNVGDKYGYDSLDYKRAQDYITNKTMRAGGAGAFDPQAPTKTFVTQNQKTIQAIDNTVPMLDKLKSFNEPGQLVGNYLHPNLQAKYESLTKGITDSMVSAFGLPKTNESIELVKAMVTKKPFETKKAYHSRLVELGNDLQSRRNMSADALTPGKTFGESNNNGTKTVTIKHKSTGQVEKVSIEEARKRGVPNV